MNGCMFCVLFKLLLQLFKLLLLQLFKLLLLQLLKFFLLFCCFPSCFSLFSIFFPLVVLGLGGF